ncbi:tryptophan--tRNA ligase [Candidatus Microgenomates bacterium]|nr:tryptophan--tRNA ligase [Candidatus Microgenomates bacterium]
MKNQYQKQANREYQEKQKLAESISRYYRDKLRELNLKDFSRIKAYLESYLPEGNPLISREIIFAHLDFEPFTSFLAEDKEFTVVSGLNPSSPLHLGHKVLFDLLLFLQKLGANIYIPVTNDESYLDGKVASLSESRRIAYEEIIPSIIAFGFNPKKTKIFVLSDYPDIYNFAVQISKYVTNRYVSAIFGEGALDNSGKAFYRSAIQLAQILLPQLAEFGGVKQSLIPVGIDQHPYILLARDVAKKMKFIPPSELVFKFQNSLLNPFEKMSGSKPKTAIYLTDSPEDIRSKIQKAYTGSVSILDAHKRLGGIPEACSVFSLLYFHHPDNQYVDTIYCRYKKGDIRMDELKKITSDFIIEIVEKHKKAKEKVGNIDEFLLNKPLRSFL